MRFTICVCERERVCVCECVCDRERSIVYVYLCVCGLREGDRGGMERERDQQCVFVCVRE